MEPVYRDPTSGEELNKKVPELKPGDVVVTRPLYNENHMDCFLVAGEWFVYGVTVERDTNKVVLNNAWNVSAIKHQTEILAVFRKNTLCVGEYFTHRELARILADPEHHNQDKVYSNFCKEMTMSELAKVLGYKVKIVGESDDQGTER